MIKGLRDFRLIETKNARKMRALRANIFVDLLMILWFYHPCSKYNVQIVDVNETKMTI
jgi:hypothetical protein